jgi:hypothetical protein
VPGGLRGYLPERQGADPHARATPPLFAVDLVPEGTGRIAAGDDVEGS